MEGAEGEIEFKLKEIIDQLLDAQPTPIYRIGLLMAVESKLDFDNIRFTENYSQQATNNNSLSFQAKSSAMCFQKKEKYSSFQDLNAELKAKTVD